MHWGACNYKQEIRYLNIKLELSFEVKTGVESRKRVLTDLNLRGFFLAKVCEASIFMFWQLSQKHSTWYELVKDMTKALELGRESVLIRAKATRKELGTRARGKKANSSEQEVRVGNDEPGWRG